MGAKTKEALKSFQSASNLRATGTLDAQTADKLGIQSGSSSSRSSSSRDNMKSSNTTVGKDTNQPNQSSSKNRLLQKLAPVVAPRVHQYTAPD